MNPVTISCLLESCSTGVMLEARPSAAKHDAVRLLLDLGMIFKDEEDRYVATSKGKSWVNALCDLPWSNEHPPNVNMAIMDLNSALHWCDRYKIPGHVKGRLLQARVELDGKIER